MQLSHLSNRDESVVVDRESQLDAEALCEVSVSVDLPSHTPHLLRLEPCLLCFAFLLFCIPPFFTAVVCQSYRAGGL